MTPVDEAAYGARYVGAMANGKHSTDAMKQRILTP